MSSGGVPEDCSFAVLLLRRGGAVATCVYCRPIGPYDRFLVIFRDAIRGGSATSMCHRCRQGGLRWAGDCESRVKIMLRLPRDRVVSHDATRLTPARGPVHVGGPVSAG
jgi:hypothetical protein